MDNTDILLDNYDVDMVTDIIIKKINNFPNIKLLIHLMSKRAGYNLSKNEDYLINYIYLARNHFFHNSLDMDILSDQLKKEIKRKEGRDLQKFDLNTFSIIIEKFQRFLEKITNHLLNFPKYNIKETGLHPTLYFYYPEIHKAPNASVYFSKLIMNKIKKYVQNKNYCFLLRHVSLFDRRHLKIFNKEFNSNYQNSDDDRNFSAKIVFIDKFSGHIKDYAKISSEIIKLKVYIQKETLNFLIKMSADIDTSSFWIQDYLTFKTDLLDFEIS